MRSSVLLQIFDDDKGFGLEGAMVKMAGWLPSTEEVFLSLINIVPQVAIFLARDKAPANASFDNITSVEDRP
jgi:hypothetical protein